MNPHRWVIVPLIALLTAGCGPTLPSSVPSSAPSLPAAPSAVAPSLGSSVSPTLRPPDSPAPTARPTGVLMGVFPAPDATIQPAAPAIIPGLRVLAIADAMTAEGLACVSEAGTDQEGGGGFTLGCEGQDDIEHARFYLTVTYWTLDAISEIYLSALWNGSGRVVNPAGPKRILSAMSAVASGELATAWIVDHIDDPACNPGCRRTYGSVQLELQVGVNGARALYVLANSG